MTRSRSIAFWFLLTIIASAALYHTSYQVQTLKRQLTQTNSRIEEEQKNLHVLQAEWVFQTNPQRLEKLVTKLTAMQPTNSKQVIALAQITDRLPTRDEQLAGFRLDGNPLANVTADLPRPKLAAASRQATVAEQRQHINNRMIIAANTGRSVSLPNGALLRFASFGSEP